MPQQCTWTFVTYYINICKIRCHRRFRFFTGFLNLCFDPQKVKCAALHMCFDSCFLMQQTSLGHVLPQSVGLATLIHERCSLQLHALDKLCARAKSDPRSVYSQNRRSQRALPKKDSFSFWTFQASPSVGLQLPERPDPCAP
jgi:hypothetical protein